MRALDFLPGTECTQSPPYIQLMRALDFLPGTECTRADSAHPPNSGGSPDTAGQSSRHHSICPHRRAIELPEEQAQVSARRVVRKAANRQKGPRGAFL